MPTAPRRARRSAPPIRIGCAGHSIPGPFSAHFPGAGSHLERYARVFGALEINSSFYRPHRAATYQRWAASVPEDFRFSVKVPKTITHEHRLVRCGKLLDEFLVGPAELGRRLGTLLVQLPGSLAYDARTAGSFFREFRKRHDGAIVIEPRHASWFEAPADALLAKHDVGRVGADPAVVAAAAIPGGGGRIAYVRLHGSPRMYYSSYSDIALAAMAKQLRALRADGREPWCIFDNTAGQAAVPNALDVLGRLS